MLPEMLKRKKIVFVGQKPVSKENRVEFQNEKRVKELHRRGYNVGNIHAMMSGEKKTFTVSQIEKMVKKKREPKDMVLDGKL